MTRREEINLIHDCLLLNYNKFEVKTNDKLIELEGLRKSIHETQRKRLETNIGECKDTIKHVKKQELNLRELFASFDKLHTELDNKSKRIKELEIELEKFKKGI